MHMSSRKRVPLDEGISKVELHVTECGIRVSWLLLWAKEVEQKLGADATTADVCAQHVIPRTTSKKCRYVDIIEPVNVGPPQYFLSHTWSWRFQTLVEVVAQRLQHEQDAFVWLDICAINQNKYEDEDELQQDDISHLADVVCKAKATLFCLDEEGKTLTRVWCLYEIWKTVKAKGAAGLELLTYRMPQLRDLFNELDVSKAKASLESDRVRILAEIASDIGYAQLSLIIKGALVDSAEREAQQALADTPALAAAHACLKAALIAKAAGKYKRAGELIVKSLELRQPILGPEHPDTLTSMNNYASILIDRGRHKEAEAVGRKVLALRAKCFGSEHPETLSSMSNYASTLKSQGKIGEAATILRQVLELRKKILGYHHPASLQSMNTLACTLGLIPGHLEEAASLKRQVLELRTNILGSEHPDTLKSMSIYASALEEMGENEKSAAMQRKALESMTNVLGADHPATLTAMNNLSYTLGDGLGKHEEAGTVLRQVIEKSTEVLGPEHPTTLAYVSNLRHEEASLQRQRQELHVKAASTSSITDRSSSNGTASKEDEGSSNSISSSSSSSSKE